MALELSQLAVVFRLVSSRSVSLIRCATPSASCPIIIDTVLIALAPPVALDMFKLDLLAPIAPQSSKSTLRARLHDVLGLYELAFGPPRSHRCVDERVL